MVSSRRAFWICVSAAVLFAASLFFLAGSALADDAKNPAGDSSAKEKAADADAIPPVPTGGPEELEKYIRELNASKKPAGPPKPMTLEERKLGFLRMLKTAQATWEAADKLLADDKATKEQKVFAARVKVGALGLLTRFGSPKARAALLTLPEELTKLGLDDLATSVTMQVLPMQLRLALKEADSEKVGKVLDQVKALAEKHVDEKGIGMVMGVVMALDQAKRTEEAAALAGDYGKLLAKSDNPKVAGFAKKLEGVVRQMKLLGETMDLSGTMLDGKPLDWNAYKGKVVLVQYWATWCAPCRAEIPNVKKLYELYHDRGFDVLGISLDNKREPLEEYVKKNEIPWNTVFEDGKENAGFDAPMAVHYGVMGIPKLILVGRDGRVVNLNARGKVLTEELEKLLGPAEPEKKDDKKDSAKKNSAELTM